MINHIHLKTKAEEKPVKFIRFGNDDDDSIIIIIFFSCAKPKKKTLRSNESNELIETSTASSRMTNCKKTKIGISIQFNDDDDYDRN